MSLTDEEMDAHKINQIKLLHSRRARPSPYDYFLG
jgi:hypothetical protein